MCVWRSREREREGGKKTRRAAPSRPEEKKRPNQTKPTWIDTVDWLSWYVVNVCDFFVGMTVLRVMSFVITPPTVSIPSDRGATSSSRMSLTSSPPSPPRMPPCTAAP